MLYIDDLYSASVKEVEIDRGRFYARKERSENAHLESESLWSTGWHPR